LRPSFSILQHALGGRGSCWNCLTGLVKCLDENFVEISLRSKFDISRSSRTDSFVVVKKSPYRAGGMSRPELDEENANFFVPAETILVA
jgi:hypothetical protein